MHCNERRIFPTDVYETARFRGTIYRHDDFSYFALARGDQGFYLWFFRVLQI